ncbi:MAG: hypothetical protein RBR77_04160 [Thauera sp.]|nr:hypothetical protein [Thauera sp.]
MKQIKKSNGYSQNVAGVKRATMNGFKNTDLPMVNIWSGPDQAAGAGAGFSMRELTIMVEIYDQTRDRPFDEVAQELALDVTMALHRATNAPKATDNPEPTLNKLITSLQRETVTPLIGEGQNPWCGAQIVFTAKYNTRNDGFTPAKPI